MSRRKGQKSKFHYGYYKEAVIAHSQAIADLWDKGCTFTKIRKKLGLEDVNFNRFCFWIKELGIVSKISKKKKADHPNYSKSHSLPSHSTTSKAGNLPIWAKITRSPEAVLNVSCPKNQKDPNPHIKTAFDQ